MSTQLSESLRASTKSLRTLLVGFIGIQLIVNIANGGAANLLVPNRIAILDPENKVALLGAIGAGAALVALVAQPLWGMLSDRTHGRYGRRFPWVLAGVLGVAATIAALAFAESFLSLLLLTAVLHAFYSMVVGPLSAVVPDRTPVEKRGLFSAVGGLGVFVGGILGVAVASQFVSDLPVGFLVLAVLVVAVAVPLTLTVRERPDAREVAPKTSWRDTLRGFFVNPRKHPDFAWAFVARLLLIVGFWSVLAFQLYILADYIGLGLAEANAVFPLAIGIATLGIIVALVPAGMISDRIGRRKPIVIIASIVIAVSTLFPVIWPSVTSALVSLGIAGLGIGIYLAVDQALMTQVLPSGADAGKDLGVLNVAQAGGQVLAPLAASLVIGLAGYAGLYIFAGVMALLGALAIIPIKSVR